MSERDDFGAFLIGFIIGGLTGAAVSLLLAPQSGGETRTIIRDKAIELKDKASVSYEEAYAKAQQAAEEARLRADELAKLTKNQAGELQRRSQVLLEQQKTRLTEVVESRRKGKTVIKPVTTEIEAPSEPEATETPATPEE